MKAGRIKSFWAPDSSPALWGEGGSWGSEEAGSAFNTPCVLQPWAGWAVPGAVYQLIWSSRSSQQKPGSPHSPLISYQSLLALGNWLGFWRLLGLILGCVNSHSYSGTEQHPYVTNRNLGSCRLVLLTGWHSYCSGGCQHVPLHVIFPGNLHHYHIYLLVLMFIVKKPKRISKETASQDRQCSLPVGTGRAHCCR